MSLLFSCFTLIYLVLFTSVYSTIWYVSLWTCRLSLRLVGKKLPSHYTDVWATGWGLGLLYGGFFLNRTKLQLEQDPKSLEHDGPFVVMMNHQSTYDIAVAFYVMWKAKRYLRWVLKKELLHAPVVGVACRETKCAFVDRKNKENARQEVKRFAEQLREDKVSAMIFVEGTRATPRKLEKSEFQCLLNPRPKGLAILHEELSDWPVLSVTIDWQNASGSTIFGSSIWRSNLRMQTKMYTPEEIGDDVSQWLVEQEWPRCDRLIQNWREPHPLSEPIEAVSSS